MQTGASAQCKLLVGWHMHGRRPAVAVTKLCPRRRCCRTAQRLVQKLNFNGSWAMACCT